MRRGVSLLGPHRDDLRVTVGDLALGTFGSRGQQRTAVLALKLTASAIVGTMCMRPPDEFQRGLEDLRFVPLGTLPDPSRADGPLQRYLKFDTRSA